MRHECTDLRKYYTEHKHKHAGQLIATHFVLTWADFNWTIKRSLPWPISG